MGRINWKSYATASDIRKIILIYFAPTFHMTLRVERPIIRTEHDWYIVSGYVKTVVVLYNDYASMVLIIF